MAKAETDEKKIIDPNGDGVIVVAAKHIIEYCFTFTMSFYSFNLLSISWHTGSLVFLVGGVLFKRIINIKSYG